MIVPIVRQPNIEPGLLDQTNITLNLFDTIINIVTTRTELEGSWAAIKWDIGIQEYLEARQRQLRDWP